MLHSHAAIEADSNRRLLKERYGKHCTEILQHALDRAGGFIGYSDVAGVIVMVHGGLKMHLLHRHIVVTCTWKDSGAKPGSRQVELIFEHCNGACRRNLIVTIRDEWNP